MVTVWLVLVLVVIVLVALIMVWSLWGRPVNAPWVIASIAFTGCVLVVGVAALRYYQALRIYDQCTASVERSGGNRNQWQDAADELDRAGITDSATFLRARLDINLPPRSLSECAKP